MVHSYLRIRNEALIYDVQIPRRCAPRNDSVIPSVARDLHLTNQRFVPDSLITMH
jgi:hypothetical protein